jgi:ATP-dependent helicase HrpB
LEQAILRAVKMALSDPAYPGGDSLIFLPGVADIRRAQEALGAFARENRLAIFPLHGELSKEEQELALGPCDRRKLILSTNIAESSLTIEGVRTVVDSGLHRQASVSSWSGMPSLHTRPISKASAIQRAGRASRTGPGLCVRVYSQGDYDHRTPHESPEIQRADLSQTLLELKSLGIRESRFEWFETPPGSSLQTARSLLYQLGATDSEEATSRLTEIGNRLAQLPTHPRVGRLLIEAQTRGCLNAATHFSALLSEGLLQGMDVLETGAKQPVPERVRKQLQNLFPKGPDSGSFSTVAANLGQCALAAFPDRVAKRRQGSGDDLVLSSGGSLKAGANGTGANGHADQGIFFLVLDARETKGWDQARSVVRATAAFPLEPEWLFGVTPSPLVEEKEALLWDTARKRVVCRNRLLYGQLVLEESETAPNDWPKVADFLLLSALGLRKETSTALSFYEWIEKLLPVCPKETLENLFAKQKLAQDYFGQEKIPSIFERLQAACYGKTSLEDLKSIEWEAALFPPERFGRSLPAQVDLPGGRKVKVQYSLDRPPWIESRLQDFFGMKQGPTLLDGKLSLTLHLLAPNYRAVQVTTDLAGFWKNTYPTVKKELSRNYPRHAWPEDPLTAQPPTYKPRR